MFINPKAGATRARKAPVPAAKYWVEGEYLTTREIGVSLGVGEETAYRRVRNAKKQPGPLTWAKLGMKAGGAK